MIRIRRLLSVIVAFALMIAVFNSYSICVEADEGHSMVACTFNDEGKFETTIGESSVDLSNQPDIDVFCFNLNIINRYSEDIEVRINGEKILDIAAGGAGSHDLYFNRTNGVDYKVATAVSSPSGTSDVIQFSVNWGGTPSGGGGSSSGTTNSNTTTASNTSAPHNHSYEWEEVRPATENDDGEMVYKCECGDVLYRVPISAYYVFNKNTAEKIKNAQQGATIKIETSKWISFHKMVMQALADRPDVSLEVSFLDGEYKGNRVSFTIPAGTDTLSLLDDNGFAGFLYLAGKFGTTG